MNPVTEFENRIAEFFGAPYAVAVDSASHGVELCLRLKKADYINVPKHTYLSIAMLAEKMGIKRNWTDEKWVDKYEVYPYIYDCAVLWQRDSFMAGTFMVVSFQFQKHLSLGKGGVILLDDTYSRDELVKMAHDGRDRDIPWREQNVKTIGYHYNMIPEIAEIGLSKLPFAIVNESRKWSWNDYPDISQMTVFKNGK